MARRKVYTPPKGKKKEPKKPFEFPRDPIPAPRPSQPSLLPSIPGLSTDACDELEAAMEAYKAVDDRVKEARSDLKKELDSALFEMIGVFVKHGQKAIVINGMAGEIVIDLKANVKGTKKLKGEQDGSPKSAVRAISLSAEEVDNFKRLVGDHLKGIGKV